MNKKEIEVTIDKNGEVKLLVKGAKGKTCLDLTKFLEDGLGEVRERKHTPEFYEKEDEIKTKNHR